MSKEIFIIPIVIYLLGGVILWYICHRDRKDDREYDSWIRQKELDAFERRLKGEE